MDIEDRPDPGYAELSRLWPSQIVRAVSLSEKRQRLFLLTDKEPVPNGTGSFPYVIYCQRF